MSAAESADEFVTWGRRVALQRLQADYPALFPAAHLDPGLRRFASDPALPMAKGSEQDKYFDHVWNGYKPEELEAMWAFAPPGPSVLQFLKQLLFLGPLVENERDAYLARSVVVEGRLKYSDSSVNEMALYAIGFVDDRLVALADGRKKGIIKAQQYRLLDADGTINNALFEFTNEVIVSRLLNTLVTAFKYTATPHFTTFLGCFRSSNLSGLSWFSGPSFVYAAYERADRSVGWLLERGHVSLDLFRSLLFQVAYTLHVASYTLGYAHNDLHPGNVMVRDVTGTRYADCVWAYKLRDRAEYVFIEPAYHDNLMVEIIDQGRATINAHAPEAPASLHRENFAVDVRTFGETCIMDLPFKQAAEIADLQLVLQKLPTNSKPRTRAKVVSREFYANWLTSVPTLFKPFTDYVVPGAPGLLPPIVVGIAPADTLASQPDEPFAVALGDLWQLGRGMKRTRGMNACVTCLAPAAGPHTFCGPDCERVHTGVFRVFG